jgi:putative tricarboxylic transport membrane protein
VIIAALATPLTKMALLFGPADYFSLMVLGLDVRGRAGARLGCQGHRRSSWSACLLSTVGTELESGEERLTLRLERDLGRPGRSGAGMGLFGFAEILKNLEDTQTRDVVHAAIGRLAAQPRRLQAIGQADRPRYASGLAARLLPGNGAVLGPVCLLHPGKEACGRPFALRPRRHRGRGRPESANNAGAQTAFIPLLTLGIPPNAVMALMVGAMTIHGIVPGPQIMTKQPQLFWGMIASMWLGNLMLLVINLPLIGLWVRFSRFPTA